MTALHAFLVCLSLALAAGALLALCAVAAGGMEDERDEDETHDPATCPTCRHVDDIGVLWQTDWHQWCGEMQEGAR